MSYNVKWKCCRAAQNVFFFFFSRFFFFLSYAVLKDWWSFSSSVAGFECDFECLSTSSGSSQLRSVRYPPPSFALLRLCVSSSRWDACPQSCDELNKVEAVCRSFCGGCWCFKMRVKKNLNSNFKSDILFFLSPSVIQFESDKKKKKKHTQRKRSLCRTDRAEAASQRTWRRKGRDLKCEY